MKTLMAYRDGKLLHSRTLIDEDGRLIGVRDDIILKRGLYFPIGPAAYMAIEYFDNGDFATVGFSNVVQFFLLSGIGLHAIRGWEVGDAGPPYNWFQSQGRGEWVYSPNLALEDRMRAAMSIEKDLMDALRLVAKTMPLELSGYAQIETAEFHKVLTPDTVWNELGKRESITW